MNYTSVLVNRIMIMFIIIFLGLICRKARLYDENFVKDLGNFLFYIVSPISIFQSFVIPYSSEKAVALLTSFALSVLMFIITIGFALIFFRKEKYCIENFGTVVCNCGFFGIPVVRAVLGSEAVFYMTPYIVINVIGQWTYGTYIMCRDKNEISIKKIMTNTVVIATILGLIFFFCRIPLPSLLIDSFNDVTGMMGPLCAVIIGSNLAMTSFSDLKKDVMTPLVCFLRLVVIPLTAILIFRNIPCSYDLKYTLIITLCTPCGASTTVFSRNFKKDSYKAARLVSVCTLLTAVSIPTMIKVLELIW